MDNSEKGAQPAPASDARELIAKIRELAPCMDIGEEGQNEEYAIENFVNGGVQFRLTQAQAAALIAERQGEAIPIAMLETAYAAGLDTAFGANLAKYSHEANATAHGYKLKYDNSSGITDSSSQPPAPESGETSRPYDEEDPCEDCGLDGCGCEVDPVMLCKGWQPGSRAPRPEAIGEVEALRTEVLKERRRLDWLIENSALDDREGLPIQLIVTQEAVEKCGGTWLPEYRCAVRQAIDDALLSRKPEQGEP